jgi:hypothetical protein
MPSRTGGSKGTFVGWEEEASSLAPDELGESRQLREANGN